jgi:hypothetical protein
MKDNIIDFSTHQKKKELAELQMYEKDALENLSLAFSWLVQALMMNSEYRENDPVNPWLLVDGYDSILAAVGGDPNENEDWVILKDICDQITAAEDTQ